MEKPRVAEEDKPRVEEEDGNEVHKNGPLIVRFPRQTTAPVETVKLESEEAQVESKPPRNMIQVSVALLNPIAILCAHSSAFFA